MVLIDNRDGSRPLAACPALVGNCRLEKLEAGDVMLTGHGPDASTLTIGIEVKSVDDLLSSISNGRLSGHQIPEMLKPGRFDHVWLAVYGQCRPARNNYLEVLRHGRWHNFKIGRTPVPWSYLEGWLLTMAMFTPIRLKWCTDRDEVGKWIAVYDRWLSKRWEAHKGLKQFNKSGEQSAMPFADPVETQIAKTAASFPGFGWDRAWKAAKHFESVEEMMDAGTREWVEIDGIGPVIASQMVGAIRRKK